MAQPRSIWKQVFVNFINSLKVKNNKVLVGRDEFGSEYYEFPGRSRGGKKSRWHVPVDNDNFEQEIPAEWEAWLRHRRKDPPTEEEIQINKMRMMQVIENAKKLEKPKQKDQAVPQGLNFPVYEEFEQEPGAHNKNDRS